MNKVHVHAKISTLLLFLTLSGTSLRFLPLRTGAASNCRTMFTAWGGQEGTAWGRLQNMTEIQIISILMWYTSSMSGSKCLKQDNLCFSLKQSRFSSDMVIWPTKVLKIHLLVAITMKSGFLFIVTTASVGAINCCRGAVLLIHWTQEEQDRVSD